VTAEAEGLFVEVDAARIRSIVSGRPHSTEG